MIIVAVLFFAVAVSHGHACTSFPKTELTSEDGAQCLTKCYFEASVRNASEDLVDIVKGENRRGRRAFKENVTDTLAPSDVCESLSSFLDCSKSCPSSRVDAVVQQITQLAQEQCSPSVTEEQRGKFLKSYEYLTQTLIDRAEHCEDRDMENNRALENDEALCKHVARCYFGAALDELSGDYPKDVVTVAVDATRLFVTFFLNDPKSSPEACSVLYEPYKA
ncbi:hypothetical protein AAVH_09547 [Aphelenchoides avenae]|nr:hypothetical protein AAVH_09547 [Aphelenchus avenae]